MPQNKETPVNLATQLAPGHHSGLLLANPVMTASGTFGYGTEYSHLFDIQRLGAIVCKGTTLQARDGNPPPRLAETASGLLNSIGLQNIGLDALIKEKAPIWASCPNVKAGGAEFGANPESAAGVTAAVKAATSRPVLVKLTPNTSDIARVAMAVAEAGADAISLINTLRGVAIDIAQRRPLLGSISGGLSGPAIKPVALYMVYQAAGAVAVPVIGCGGITTASDAIEFLMAGASAVQVGTAGFSNPRAPLDVLEGIERFMKKEGIREMAELIGAGRR